jgi:DNA-binding transcriptional MerR regulator
MTTEIPKIFFTADIVALLKIPEWRVLKFAQGTEYQISPSHSDASGSGTRRVYDIEDVCQIALALRLLDSGLGSKAIGQILRMLRRKGGLSQLLEWDNKKLNALCLLIFRKSQLRRHPYASGCRDAMFVVGFAEAQVEQAERPQDDFMLLNVGSTFRVMKFRLRDLQKKKGS